MHETITGNRGVSARLAAERFSVKSRLRKPPKPMTEEEKNK